MAVVLTSVELCSPIILHRAFFKVAYSLMAVHKCETCDCTFSLGTRWYRSLPLGWYKPLSYYPCDQHREKVVQPVFELLLFMVVNHEHLLSHSGNFSEWYYLITWSQSTTVGPVCVGSLWAICGTEASILAGEDHQGESSSPIMVKIIPMTEKRLTFFYLLLNSYYPQLFQ